MKLFFFLSASFLSGLFFLLSGCQSADELEFDRGRMHEERGNFSRALVHYKKTISRTQNLDLLVKAASSGAEISISKIRDFPQAVQFLKTIVQKSKSDEVILEAQKKIALLYFEKLSDYKNAIPEVNRVLGLENNPLEKHRFRLILARSYFYQNNLYQSETEAKEILKSAKEHDLLFSTYFLLGNIYQADQKTEKAVEVFQKIVTDFPKLAIQKNVGFNLALTFEEREDFEKAISVFKAIRDHYPSPKYIDLKIQRLTKRLKNLPGASGRLRK